MKKDQTLDLPALESWLWEAACAIRGPVDASKFKDYILPLIFLKRLSDVFDDEVERLGEEYGSRQMAAKLVEQDHQLVRFYVPENARWPAIRKKTTGLGEYLTDAVQVLARENPRLHGVIDIVDFNATTAGQRIVDDPYLANLVEVLSKHRLGLDEVEPDLIGRAYEYLLRKFAEDQGQSAGEFYTPREVGVLMARLLDPQPGMEVYDPACGSGGLLVKCHLRLLETHGVRKNGHLELPPSVAPLRVYGQDINPTTFAMAWMNAVLHDMEAEIALSDTMQRPAFTEDSRLKRFDLVIANPMWNQKFPPGLYENDSYERFRWGIPPGATADWGWIQHMYASLGEKGRMAVVLDTGAVSRGSGNTGSNKERDIRKKFVDDDLIEAVVLLPENLFYNTTAPGIIIVINRAKRHPGDILLVNASRLFSKGRPKNYLEPRHIDEIVGVLEEWKEISGVTTLVPAKDAAARDYNLSPSRYILQGFEESVLSPEDALVLLAEAEEERAAADRELLVVLQVIGLNGWNND